MPANIPAAISHVSLYGYHLSFDAEMSGAADMSQFINMFSNGNTNLYTNHEAENYVPYGAAPVNPYEFVNGALVVNGVPVPNGGQPYTSGLLDSTQTSFTGLPSIFSQNTGYFEIRAATPAAAGFWPAFWLLPNGAFYPEIDILEQPNNSGTKTEYWTHISTATDNSGGFTDTGVNLTQGYHRYGFMWTPDTIQFTFDGHYIGSPHETPPSMANLKMYILANLAVGGPGSWPGVPPQGASSTYGIDYIRVFSNDPTVPAVNMEPISSPDGADTTPDLGPPPPVTPPPIGTGPDALVLQMAEDYFQGNAKFTVSVDGRQYGKVQTTSAWHSFGQTQPFTVNGNFRGGKHTVTVNFKNNANGTNGDRNLYVTGATLDGTPITDAVLNEYGGGPQSFLMKGDPPPQINIGSGPDTFVFGISGVPYNGIARYTMSIDGVQQGGVQIARALHTYGQSQIVAVAGNFGPGTHTATVDFLNGDAQGSNAPNRTLYLDSLNYDGTPTPGGSYAFQDTGPVDFAVPSSSDTLTLGLTEDSFQGDAQAQISLDGSVLGTVTVTAPNVAGGTPQTATFTGSFHGAYQQHLIMVSFLNDLYVGPGQDRNLYVQSAQFDGSSFTSGEAIMRNGPVTFTYQAASPPQ